MFIKPMTAISDIKQLQNVNNLQKSTDQGSFKNIFEDAIKDVYDANKKVDENAYNLVAGNTDNLHTMQIDLEKAQLSTSYMIQLRNKTLESYNEIIRITV